MAATTNVETDGFGNSPVTSPSVQRTKISANGTITLKSGPGRYYGMMCTVLGTTWTAALYDSLTGSGETIVPTMLLALGAVTDAQPPAAGLAFDNGLTVVLAGILPGTIYVLWS